MGLIRKFLNNRHERRIRHLMNCHSYGAAAVLAGNFLSNDEDGRFHAYRADALYEIGHVGEAINHMRTAIKIADEKRIGTAVSQYEQRLDEFTHHCEHTAPDHSLPIGVEDKFSMVFKACDGGDYRRAEEIALSMLPHDNTGEVSALLGGIYFNAGRLHDAREAYATARLTASSKRSNGALERHFDKMLDEVERELKKSSLLVRYDPEHINVVGADVYVAKIAPPVEDNDGESLKYIAQRKPRAAKKKQEPGQIETRYEAILKSTPKTSVYEALGMKKTAVDMDDESLKYIARNQREPVAGECMPTVRINLAKPKTPKVSRENYGYKKAYGFSNDEVIARYNKILSANPAITVEEAFRRAADVNDKYFEVLQNLRMGDKQ